MLRVGEVAVQIVPVGGNAGKRFRTDELGKDVKSLFDQDVKIHKETGVFSKESAGFDVSKCGSL